MTRPLTEEERQVLMANPELVMFKPRHTGMHPTVFLLVIPVTTMVVVAAIVYFAGLVDTLVEQSPVISCLLYVGLCAVVVPWSCLRLKWWYDDAYGCDRELRRYLAGDVAVERVRITGFVPQRAEVYAEGDDGPFMFGIASTRNAFAPEEGTDVALLHAAGASMAVRPDPRTQSLLV
ncbi:MAG: hypothetical protein IKG69_05060 [Atopobiaceae bacterium]|nr:hypothetical protein [Atopobiaceae bacterium]